MHEAKTSRVKNNRQPTGRNRRLRRLITITMIVTSFLCSAAPLSPAAAQIPGARPDFRLPFPCEQKWKLQTYRGHNPDDKKIDMYRVGGSTLGSDVVTSAAGTVHQFFDPGGVEINHGGGWFTVYLHLRVRSVRIGQRVAGREKIGEVGDVGPNGTKVAPHLHYEQLYDSNNDGDGETNEMAFPVIQGQEYRMNPNGPFPEVVSTNGCSGTLPETPPSPSPGPTPPGDCTHRPSSSHHDARRATTWSGDWLCPNVAGIPIYKEARSGSPVVGILASNPSWFVCWTRGEPHAGGNDVWYYTQGDRTQAEPNLNAWGFVPAVKMGTKVDPDPSMTKACGFNS